MSSDASRDWRISNRLHYALVEPVRGQLVEQAYASDVWGGLVTPRDVIGREVADCAANAVEP